MKRTILIILAVLIPILIIGGGLLWMGNTGSLGKIFNPSPATTTPAKSVTTNTSSATLIPISATGYKNATYIINGKPVALVNGRAETSYSNNSASKLVTAFFGDVAVGRLTSSNYEDAAFIITQSAGGSGTYYYIVAATQTANGVVGSNTIPLGDRIAPQSVTISNGTITVSYAIRKPTDPMTTPPSVMVSKSLVLARGILTQVLSK